MKVIHKLTYRDLMAVTFFFSFLCMPHLSTSCFPILASIIFTLVRSLSKRFLPNGIAKMSGRAQS